MAVSMPTISPALPAHALTGAGGWADEIISFGFIIAIIAILVLMSRLGRRKRLREEERNRQDATD